MVRVILDDIEEKTRKRLIDDMKCVEPDEMEHIAEDSPRPDRFPFERALERAGISAICEVKKASPSKGIIAEDFPYKDIAMEYESAGADAISVLTERDFFLGSIDYLKGIAKVVHTPLLRKDFIIDTYQIFEARAAGASAVLLICAVLDDERLRTFIKQCDHLGLSALVEAHDSEEVKRAVSAGARIVGVNNRSLKDFTVSPDNAERLRPLVPKNVLFVAESGMKTAEDVKHMEDIGADAVLIGESLMRAENRSAKLHELVGR